MAVVSLRLYLTPMIELSQIRLLNRGKVLGYILQPLHELTTQRLTLLITNALSRVNHIPLGAIWKQTPCWMVIQRLTNPLASFWGQPRSSAFHQLGVTMLLTFYRSCKLSWGFSLFFLWYIKDIERLLNDHGEYGQFSFRSAYSPFLHVHM